MLLVKLLVQSRSTSGCPLSFPPEFPSHLPGPGSPLLRRQEAGSEEWFCTRQSIYSCVLSARCFSVTYIYFYILLRHTWFLGVVEKRRGWLEAEGGRCGRRRQMAPGQHLGTWGPSLGHLCPSSETISGSPVPSAPSPYPPAVPGGAPADSTVTFFCQIPFALCSPNLSGGNGAGRGSATRQLCDCVQVSVPFRANISLRTRWEHSCPPPELHWGLNVNGSGRRQCRCCYVGTDLRPLGC